MPKLKIKGFLCPYCNKWTGTVIEIEKDVYKCPYCDELLTIVINGTNVRVDYKNV